MLWTWKDPRQAGWPRASAELGSDAAPVAQEAAGRCHAGAGVGVGRELREVGGACFRAATSWASSPHPKFPLCNELLFDLQFFSALTFFINDATSLSLPHFALLENGKDTASRLSRTDRRAPLLITSRSESFMPRQGYDVLPVLRLLYGI